MLVTPPPPPRYDLFSPSDVLSAAESGGRQKSAVVFSQFQNKWLLSGPCRQTCLSAPAKPRLFKLPSRPVISKQELGFLDSSNCDVAGEQIPSGASSCGWTESFVFSLEAKRQQEASAQPRPGHLIHSPSSQTLLPSSKAQERLGNSSAPALPTATGRNLKQD